MISKILIATDGSEAALKASRYAVDLAKQLSASIIVLSVIDNRSFPSLHTVPKDASQNPGGDFTGATGIMKIPQPDWGGYRGSSGEDRDRRIMA